MGIPIGIPQGKKHSHSSGNNQPESSVVIDIAEVGGPFPSIFNASTVIEYVFASSSPVISYVNVSVAGYTRDVSVKLIIKEKGKGSAIIICIVY